MPFGIETKTEMFIRSGRLCCLCLKQCGTNIEAAHIIDEGRGGSNDAENGIPVCFDCHQELGAYNDDHPRGNKFRPDELRARRDRVYGLVESGVIYAQVVTQQLPSRGNSGASAELAPATNPPKASSEAVRFLGTILSSSTSAHAAVHKIRLLNNRDRAYVLDELLRSVVENPQAVSVLGQIVTDPIFPKQDAMVLIEQIVRALTLFGDSASKAEFLTSIPPPLTASIYEGLRLAFFADLIAIINQDQFEDVNKIVPAIVNHVAAIPSKLFTDYVFALFQQARSQSWYGAPAARRAVLSIPDEVAMAAMDSMDTEFLFWNSQHEVVRDFARRFKHPVPDARRGIFEDLATLSPREFVKKHIPEDLF